MFEAQVAYYLNKYLGKYVYGLDAESLKISVWRGDVQLSNLQLKPEALQDLNLPVTVIAGLLGKLTLKVPWAKLGRDPVVVEIDRLYILASPRVEEDTGVAEDVDQYEVKAARAELEEKRKKILDAEMDWIKNLEETSKDGKHDEEKAAGRFRGLINTIIANLQLKVTNLHIRYEDSVSNPGHPFSVGVMLREVSAHTVDELGRKAFVTASIMESARKAVLLQQLSVYFDVDVQRLAPKKKWTQLEQHEWDAMFIADAAAATARGHRYLLCPVDGKMVYTRLAGAARRSEADPKQHMDLALESISVRLGHPQFTNLQRLLEMFDQLQARAPHYHWRPKCRPRTEGGARLWWRYAYSAVQKAVVARTIRWADMKRTAELRRKYIPAYVRCIQQAKLGGDDAIEQLDAQLPEGTITLFRRLAHAQVEVAKRKSAAQEVASKAPAPSRWGGWLGGGAKPAAGKAGSGMPPAGPGENPELGPEEWATLHQLMDSAQEPLDDGGRETPYTLLLKLNVVVETTEAVLAAEDGTEIVAGRLTKVSVGFDSFPKTMKVQAAIKKVSVTCPDGPLVATGVLPEPKYGRDSHVISVGYTQQPQDGSADAVVKLSVLPTYVTYSRTAINSIIAFFRRSESVQLGRLQAHAASRADQLRKLAQMQLKALSQAEQKPKLLLSLSAHAPKVALPNSSGSAWLVVDLGLFSLRTHTEARDALPPDEAALFECFQAGVKGFAAYLVHGPFAWRSDAAGLGQGPGPPQKQGLALLTSESTTAAPGSPAAGGGSEVVDDVLALHLPAGSVALPLVERFALSVKLQAATAQHPRLPQARMSVTATPLRAHMSPFRLQHLMSVVRALIPDLGDAGDGANGNKQAQQSSQPSWIANAEYSAPVKVLVWEGLVERTSKWCPRYLYVWQGRVFVTKDQASTAPLVRKSFWQPSWRVVMAAPANVAGAENVVAITPAEVRREEAAQDTRSLLLRCETRAEAATLRSQLLQSKSQMTAIAGLLSLQVGDESEAEEENDERPDDALEAAMAHRPVLELKGSISEIACSIYGRLPPIWWPDAEAAAKVAGAAAAAAAPAAAGDGTDPAPRPRPSGSSLRTYGEPNPALSAAGIHCVVQDANAISPAELEAMLRLEDEVPLLTVRLDAARLGLCQKRSSTHLDVAMRSLEVDDLLVGSICPAKAAMARSLLPARRPVEDSQQLPDHDDEYFDAEDGSGPQLDGARGDSASSHDSARGDSGAGFDPTQYSSIVFRDKDLAAVRFTLMQPNSPGYSGTDAELELRVSSLTLAGNRPTIAALMVFGKDMAAVPTILRVLQGGPWIFVDPNAAQGQPDSGPPSPGPAPAAPGVLGEAAATVKSAAGAAPPPRATSDERTTFKLKMAMQRLELAANYEGETAGEFARVAVDNFAFDMRVHPATLDLSTSLGNMVAEYRSLPASSPYSTICTMRSSEKGSLIQLFYRMNSVQDSLSHPIVPDGYPFHTIRLQLSAVQGVFMRRFITEIVQYVQVMLAMQPPQLLPPPQFLPGGAPAPPVSDSEGEEPEGPPAAVLPPAIIELDISVEAPIVTMPQTATSTRCGIVDLGTARVSNVVRWEPAPGGGRVLIDAISVQLSGLSAVIDDHASLRRGENLIKELGDGVVISVRRPVLGEGGAELPPVTVAVAVPTFRAAISDSEYRTLLAVITGNMGEPSGLPQDVAWLHYQVLLARADALGNAGEAARAAQNNAEQLRRALSPRSSRELPRVKAAVLNATQTASLRSCDTHIPTLLKLVSDRCATKVTVSVGQATLALLNDPLDGGRSPPTPLGSVTFSNMWLTYHGTERGNLFLSIAVPTISARDERPGVPRECSAALSTAVAAAEVGEDGTGLERSLTPSLATVELRQLRSVGEPVLLVRVRLQRPTITVDIAFILAIITFVLPSGTVQGAAPQAYDTRELHLGAEPHVASGNLWLSPEFRIIADAPSVRDFVYDGKGTNLFLPLNIPPSESLPLIVVGKGRTLTLRNVKLLNASSLAACLLLGSGARLIAEREDGVEFVDWETREQESFRRISTQQDVMSALAVPPPQPPAALVEVDATAVGMSLRLVDVTRVGGPGAARAGATPAPATGSPSPQIRRKGSSTALSAAAAAAIAGEIGMSGNLLRTLALQLDLAGSFKQQGPTQEAAAQLRRLSVETQMGLSEGTAAETSKDDMPAVGADVLPPGAVQVRSRVLEPCDIVLQYNGGPRQADVNVSVSDIAVKLSPDALQLVLHLQRRLLEPLVKPPPDAPLARCDRFEHIWSSHGAVQDGPPYPAAGAGGVDVLGSDRGITFWRPQPPYGYAIVGDVVTAGSAQPGNQVVAVALNSGLVSWPVDYTEVWRSDNVTVWRALPQAGYVALGCVAVAGSGSRPSPKAVACVHHRAVVDTYLGQCMMLATNGNIWCVQNSASTFEVSAAESHLPGSLVYDLRSPLGVPPAALMALNTKEALAGTQEALDKSAAAAAASAAFPGDKALPPSLLAFKVFHRQRAALLRHAARQHLQTSAVEFQRVWWDKRSKHPSDSKVSFWRPIPPPGYVSLGDCLVVGVYAPPLSALVLRDDFTQQGEGDKAMLARPIRFVQVWFDEHKLKRGGNCLSLWKPVPPPGYVAVGMLASLGMTAPPMGAVRCVRADMVAAVQLSGDHPTWRHPAHKERLPVLGWVVDEEARTFVVAKPGGMVNNKVEAWQLRRSDLETEVASPRPTTPGGQPQDKQLNVKVEVSRISMLLRSTLRAPVLELDANNITFTLFTEGQNVMRCCAFLQSSLWSYNPSLFCWEPVLEPWTMLMHVDVNNGPAAPGLMPGVGIRLKSTEGALHVTLAHAAVNSTVEALAEWRNLQNIQGSLLLKRQLAAAEGSTVHTVLVNTLGAPAQLRLDFGDHQEFVALLPGQPTTVLQPLPLPSSGHGPARSRSPPPIHLLVDVLEGDLPALGERLAGRSEVMVSVRMGGRAAGLMEEASWGLLTRAVVLDEGQPPHAAWNERFVLAMPLALSEHLLSPAPGDNQFEGTPLELELSVLDGAASSGLGACLGSISVPLPYEWLMAQVAAVREQGRKKRRTHQAAPARATGQVAEGELGMLVPVELGDPASPSVALTMRLSLDEATVDVEWHAHVLHRKDKSAVGRRALKLEGSDTWAAISASSLQAAVSGSRSADQVVAVRAGEGVALESSYADGTRREVLRSLGQFLNHTNIALEVAVVDQGEDAAWQMVPAVGSVQGAMADEEVFENERYVPFKGWSPSNLLQTDGKRFRKGNQTSAEFPVVVLPPGWEWDGPWEVERSGDVDSEGWAYAFEFAKLGYPPPAGAGTRRPTDFVRRRRWVRRRRRVGTAGSGAAAAQRQVAQPATAEGQRRVVLGVVPPGGRLGLPYGWRSGSRELQARPAQLPPSATNLAPERPSTPPAPGRGPLEDGSWSHGWSQGASNGRQSVALASVEEATARLVCCKATQQYVTAARARARAGSSGSGGASGALAEVSDCWISMLVDADMLVPSQGAEPLSDYRIMAHPPMLVHNLLPVPATYMLWERSRADGPLVMRQKGRVDAGEAAHVYAADMRAQVCLTFTPEGCRYAEPEPVVVSHGYFSTAAGVLGQQQLATSFGVAYQHTSSQSLLRIYIEREVDVAMVSQGGMRDRTDDPGAAVAMGLPLTVRLFVPLWVINATQLPITTGILSMDPGDMPAEEGSQPGQPAGSGASSRGDGQPAALRVIDTEAFSSVAKPQLAATIMPNSVEMMSYPLNLDSLQFAVCISVMGSQWSAPIMLRPAVVAGGGTAGAAAAAAGQLPRHEPVLIKARSRQDSGLYEVTARLQPAGVMYSRSQVLRLDPHIILSNRTGYTLHLMQPNALPPSGYHSPSSSYGSLPGVTATAPVASHSSPALSSFSQSRGGSAGSLQGAQPPGRKRPRGPTIELPPGAVGVPLHCQGGFDRKTERHLLAISLAHEGDLGTGRGEDGDLWSEAFEAEYPGGVDYQVVVPVYIQGSDTDAGPSDGQLGGAAVSTAKRYFRRIYHPHASGSPGSGPGRPGPEIDVGFIRCVRPIDDGVREFLAVVVQVSIQIRNPGCLHVVLQSIGGDPQQLLVNCTSASIKYRQHVPRAMWQTLRPFSAEGFAQLFITDSPPEVELRDESPESSGSEVVSLDPNAAMNAAALRSRSRAGTGRLDMAATVLTLAGGSLTALAQVVDVSEGVLSSAGLLGVPGANSASLGHPRLDRLLRIMPRPPQPSTGASALQLMPGGRAARPGQLTSGMYLSIDLPALDVSVVDHRPQELALLSMDGLSVQYRNGRSAGIAYSQLHCCVMYMQLDDMLPGSAHPVVLVPADLATRGGPPPPPPDPAAAEPTLYLAYVSEPGRRRGVLYSPCISAGVSRLVLAVSETLVWRLYGVVTNLRLERLAAGDTTAQQVSSDSPLEIDLLNFDDVDAKISFRTDVAARPRFNQALSLGLEFANIDELVLQIPGIELEKLKMPRSMFVTHILSRLQDRALSIAFSVLKTYGVSGLASKILAVASEGVAQLAEEQGASGSRSRREVTDVGEGVVEGGKAFARGLFRGAVGIVTKPIQGAEKGGFSGFVEGVARGLVGAAANPVSGMLAAASKVTEGFDATSRSALGLLTGDLRPRKAVRRRLPRATRADRVLRPFQLHGAIGAALLAAATVDTSGAGLLFPGLGASRSANRQAAFSGDSYDAHFSLPDDKVVLITNRRVMLLKAPGYNAWEMSVLSGEAMPGNTVPGGVALWHVPWQDMLTAELARLKQSSGPPDSVLVHRNRRGPADELMHDINCRPQSRQANDVLASILAARKRYFTEPRQEVFGWKELAMPVPSGMPNQQLPDSMLSLEWRCVWFDKTPPPGRQKISIWRPVGPPGYASIGDVAVVGLDQPSRPVQVYRDCPAPDEDETEPEAGAARQLAPPDGYQLIFREASRPNVHPLTLWRPIPPQGYLEMGHVAVPALEEPSSRAVRCVRRDLVQSTKFSASPLWQARSADSGFWEVGLWTVDSPAGTFVVERSGSTPAPGYARVPTY